MRRDEDAASDTVSTPRSEDRVGGSNYWIPALEIPVFLGFLNGAARVLYPNEMQDGKRVSRLDMGDHAGPPQDARLVNDQDPFNVNQFSHPYLGATMFNFPRSTGVGFWPSLIYANAGSFMWEMAGETTPPSINDIITTGQAGSLLGEAMYRIAATVWRDRPDGKSQPWHRLLADLIDPARGVNSHVAGRRVSDQTVGSVTGALLAASAWCHKKMYSRTTTTMPADACSRTRRSSIR